MKRSVDAFPRTSPARNVDTNIQDSGHLLPRETLQALENLAMVLKPIYLRMKREGHCINNGTIKNVKEHERRLIKHTVNERVTER
jgi:hypothetical protein